jgi:hypothetical protein
VAGDSARSSTSPVQKLAFNPVIDAGLRHIERQASSTENFIFPLPKHLDRLLESTRDLVETRNVIFVMLNRIKRHGVQKIGQAVVDALHLRYGHLLGLQFVVRNAVVQNVKQEIV